MAEFRLPDFREPIDVEEQIRRTPANAVVKGMYLQRLVELAEQHGGGRSTKKYIAFRDCPMRELMRLVANTAALMYPDLPAREGICAVGRFVFPTLQSSIAGRVLFSFAGNSYEAALKLAAQGYAHSQSPGSAHLAKFSPGEAILELRGMWNFPDCYQVGVHEGALGWYERSGTVEVRVLSPCDVDLRIRWRSR